MTTNRDVAKAFTEHRKATSLHMFTDGKVVYSYGYHFPIAVWSGDEVYFNKDGYSQSTAKHKSYVKTELAQHMVDIKGELSTEELQKKAKMVEATA